MTERANVVIIGAGMAGVACAYQLAVTHGVRHVVLIDEHEPLTLTSAVGTQGFRNWWPGPDDTMCRFVSRSLDLVEGFADESGNAFRLAKRGYLFATVRDEGVAELRETARAVSGYGMGALREHRDGRDYVPSRAEGYRDMPDGADLLVGDAAREAFPYLAPSTRGALHVRRAGWMNAIALGAWLLRRCIGAGVRVLRDRVDAIDSTGGRVRGVRLASGASLGAERVVLAAGPMLPEALRLVGAELPVSLELHAKLTMRDPRGAIPRDAPFVIWNDPVTLGDRTFPAGVHARPVDGPHGDEAWLIWTYDDERRDVAEWPPRFDPEHGEILLRGASQMIPAFAAYDGHAIDGVVDGGYYCKTPENRPLVGPLGIEGAYVCAALSGYGIMASHAAGELLAQHLVGAALPSYAAALLPSRYEEIRYRETLAAWGARVGQL